jgi:DNA-binding response OmpR family regulator
MEQRLLSILKQSPNQVVRLDDVVVALYGNVDSETGRTRLRRLVADLRMRLGVDFSAALRTVRGVGLVLDGNAFR